MDDRQAGPTLGFLTVLHDAAGYTGGYLVVNAWGRPLEFRLTTPVQPNRVQEILYGATLADYIHADLIGRTLVEKTAATATLIVTDTPAVLPLGSRLDLPVVAVGEAANGFEHPRSSQTLTALSSQDAVIAILDRVDAAVDLAEPFARIRDAVREARTTGANRAA